jgi:hypothetical protein
VNPGCDQCLHFRPKRRLDALLTIPTAQVTRAPNEIRDREVQLEHEEAQVIIDVLKTGGHWPTRPLVLPYCGLEEERGTYLAHESKNAGGRCEDFVPALGAARAECESCTHRQEAPGPKRDRAENDAFIGRTRGFGTIIDEHYNSNWDSIRDAMQRMSQHLDDLKSAEMLQALDSDGVMTSEPRYYDICRRYSGSGEYVLCRVRNFHGHCPGYSPASDSAGGPPTRGLDWDEGGTF